VASAQAAATGPDLAKILGIPLLGVTVAVDVAATTAAVAFDVLAAASTVTFALATQDQGLFQVAGDVLNEVPKQFDDLVSQVQVNINTAAEAFGLPDPFPGATLPSSVTVSSAVAVKDGVTGVKGASTANAATSQEAKPAKSGLGMSAPNPEQPVSTPHKGSPVSSTSADDSQPSSSESTTDTTKDSNTGTDETTATGATTKADGISKTDRTTKAGVSTKPGGTSAAGGASNTGGAKAGKAGAHSARSSGPKGDHHGATKNHNHDK
jgi:hypothetical protein